MMMEYVTVVWRAYPAASTNGSGGRGMFAQWPDGSAPLQMML